MPAFRIEDYDVIDADTHISEPENLWTSRTRDHLAANFSDLPEASLRKVLHDNAARVYRID